MTTALNLSIQRNSSVSLPILLRPASSLRLYLCPEKASTGERMARENLSPETEALMKSPLAEKRSMKPSKCEYLAPDDAILNYKAFTSPAKIVSAINKEASADDKIIMKREEKERKLYLFLPCGLEARGSFMTA